MFKGYQDTSNQSQFKGFPNLNMQGAVSAYGFSGVSFWLDAAYGLNTQTDLGAVSSWQQRIGGGTFVQATALSQPRLILSDANYNGYPSVQSVDNSRFMSASMGVKINPSITLVIISKINTIQASNGLLRTGLASSGPGIIDGGTNANYNGFGYFSNSTTPIIQGTTESTNARIKILTSTNIIINGTIETTGSLGANYVEFVDIFRHASGTSSIIGTIAEIIAFPYSMTSTDAIALSDRINQKYALY